MKTTRKILSLPFLILAAIAASLYEFVSGEHDSIVYEPSDEEF